MLAYKYLSQQHLALFKEKGTIRINTLHALRTATEKIRDPTEGLTESKIGSDTKPWVKFTAPKESNPLVPVTLKAPPELRPKGLTVHLGKGVFIAGKQNVQDAYVFCTSLKLEREIGSQLGHNAYYIIKDVDGFAETLSENLNDSITIKGFKIAKVQYVKTKITASNHKEVKNIQQPDYLTTCFTKPKEYATQTELRMLFIPYFNPDILPLTIDCPKLRQYCVF